MVPFPLYWCDNADIFKPYPDVHLIKWYRLLCNKLYFQSES